MRRRHPARNHSHAAAGTAKRIASSTYLVILITALILLGIVIGTLIVKNGGTENQNAFGLFMQAAYSNTAGKKTFLNLMLSSFFTSGVLLCATFLLGLCAVGLPITVLVPLFRGIGLGYTVSYLYVKYGLKGIAFSALCILPQGILTAIAVIISCTEGIRFSVKIFSVILPSGGGSSLWDSFSKYAFKFVICFLLIVLASLLEASTTVMLAGFISG